MAVTLSLISLPFPFTTHPHTHIQNCLHHVIWLPTGFHGDKRGVAAWLPKQVGSEIVWSTSDLVNKEGAYVSLKWPQLLYRLERLQQHCCTGTYKHLMDSLPCGWMEAGYICTRTRGGFLLPQSADAFLQFHFATVLCSVLI